MATNNNNAATSDSIASALIGSSAAIQRLRSMISRIAKTNASILLTGPSGSGKELVARAIHQASSRGLHPFAAVNCGAIPSDLIESELFGHEKGAFTGAIARRIGHFESGHRGTIFLDEIGDMRYDMQVKLLRVIEDRTIVRVGSNEVRPVDVRIISATHQNLQSAIANGQFREDLFFRLGVVVVQVPSLADRVEDIPALIAHFQQNVPFGQRCRFGHDVIAMLMQHDWPGNVRELRNLVERANALHPGEQVSLADSHILIDPSAPLPMPPVTSTAHANAVPGDSVAQPFNLAPVPTQGRPIDLKREIEAIELEQIHVALELADGIIAEAARLLTLKRTTLIEKMRKYGLQQQAA